MDDPTPRNPIPAPPGAPQPTRATSPGRLEALFPVTDPRHETGPGHPRHQNDIRRDILVAGLCLAAAAPSFSMAVLGQYDIAAMVVGVLLFTGSMIVFARTPGFRSFTRERFVRRTLHGVYGLRLLISIGTPLVFIVDAFPGLMLVAGFNAVATGLGWGADFSFLPAEITPATQPGRFLATLILVLAQGFVLNLLLACIFIPALFVQRVLCGRSETRDTTTKAWCLQCRHSLHGIPSEAPCPECGWGRDTAPPSWIDRFSPGMITMVTVILVSTTVLLSMLLREYAD